MAFCDWLTIRQTHEGGGLPIINGGCVVVIKSNVGTIELEDDQGAFTAIDSDQIEYTLEKKLPFQGSYDSNILIRCDGRTVELSGNIGRFNRPDNVFGYSVTNCIDRASRLIARFGLPPFSDQGILYLKGCDKNVIDPYSAFITRVDLTQNYRTGSDAAARRLVNFFGGHSAGRMAPRNYGNGITWGQGSKYVYSKLYIKADSLADTASDRTKQYIKDNGFVRHEVCLKSRYLTQHHLRTIYAWQQKEEGKTMDNVVYGRFSDVLDVKKNSVSVDPYNELPLRIAGIATAWRNGFDIWNDPQVSKRTKYRYRAELRTYGIDIKYPCDVSRIATTVQLIKLEAAGAPNWYWAEHGVAERQVA